MHGAAPWPIFYKLNLNYFQKLSAYYLFIDSKRIVFSECYKIGEVCSERVRIVSLGGSWPLRHTVITNILSSLAVNL